MRERRINQQVERMQRYVPLDAGADQLVHEHVDVLDSVSIATKAETALLGAVQRADVRLVLLTGDAGHGKTRLCCALLEALSFDKQTAADTIRNSADGAHDLLSLADGRALRIVKDLSDYQPDHGSDLLVGALDASERITVMCVNEGRLRDLVSHRPTALQSLLTRLEDGLEGDADASGGVVIINLNFQSVGSTPGSLVEDLLRQWIGDGRNWSACRSCRSQNLCPIYENRRLLSDDPAADTRAGRWAELLRIAERTGTVVTIRELLITVAFSLTSGLRCEDVHQKTDAAPLDRSWQWEHLFFQSLFDGIARLEQSSSGLRVPPALRRLDPGRFADRQVDEHLTVDDTGISFRPVDPTGDFVGSDRSQTADQERDEQLRLTRFLRRRAFFDDDSIDAPSRVGLRFGGKFETVVAGTDTAAPRDIRDTVVAGLAAAQGVYASGDRPTGLPIVEPALAGRGSGIAILDREVRLADVAVMSLSEAWKLIAGTPSALVQQVDWVERHAAVVIEKRDVIALDLRAFELVCAAGQGLDLRTADPGVARRILLELAGLAGQAGGADRIDVVEPGRRWRIDLDIDDQLIGRLT